MIEPACILKINSLLGECPVWSREENALYWIDILKGFIHRFDPQTKKNATIELNQPVTSLGLCREKKLILTLRDQIALFDLQHKTLKPFGDFKKKRPNNRFNSGKCDQKGRFWCATMNEKEPNKDTGSIYRIDHDHSIHPMEDHVILSNGMGWSPDNSIFYFTQTLRHTIFAYDFDPEIGSISNKRVFVKMEPCLDGGPDGLTVDAEGFVWSTHHGTGRIIRYDPQGKIDNIIQLPTPRVTCCTFGGEHLDTLYITTAQEKMTENDLKQFPLSGSLFACKPGVKGLAEFYYQQHSKKNPEQLSA